MDELDEKLDEIMNETGDYEKIKSELGDSYLASGEVADDELESIIGEFGEGGGAPVASVKDRLSTDELIAVKEGTKMPSPYNMDSATVVVPDVAPKSSTGDVSAEHTMVFGAAKANKTDPHLDEKTDYEEKDDYGYGRDDDE